MHNFIFSSASIGLSFSLTNISASDIAGNQYNYFCKNQRIFFVPRLILFLFSAKPILTNSSSSLPKPMHGATATFAYSKSNLLNSRDPRCLYFSKIYAQANIVASGEIIFHHESFKPLTNVPLLSLYLYIASIIQLPGPFSTVVAAI